MENKGIYIPAIQKDIFYLNGNLFYILSYFFILNYQRQK